VRRQSPAEADPPRTRKKEAENEMYGLIKPSTLERLNQIGSLALGILSVAAVFLVLATAFTGGGVA
jgi:hypothetical protein